MKIDVMLSSSVVDAAERAQALSHTGVDGVFSFENAHDLFFPLVAAAPVCSLDLMTNVAIAFPRSPMHLAHSEYDLHLLSEGRFRLGLGSQIERRQRANYGESFLCLRRIARRNLIDDNLGNVAVELVSTVGPPILRSFLMCRHKQITAGPSDQVAYERSFQVNRFHTDPSRGPAVWRRTGGVRGRRDGSRPQAAGRERLLVSELPTPVVEGEPRTRGAGAR